jgi:hypothetical protein
VHEDRVRGAVWGVAGLMLTIHQDEFLTHFGIRKADPARKTELGYSSLANRMFSSSSPASAGD